MAMRDYLISEVALDHAEGHLSRREALRRLGLMGLSAVAASGVLAACASEPAPVAPAPPVSTPKEPGYDVSAATARSTAITFEGPAGTLSAAYAAPDGTPKGAVLVVHENRGLTDHFRAVTGRLAGDGYAVLAPDLLSRSGGTAAVPDATAALGALAAADLVADLQAGLAELGRRHPGVAQAAMGFCFGGGMVWRLLAAPTPALAAAVPFYGPLPDGASFEGDTAAVLAVYAELDQRVNATRDAAQAALTSAGLVHEIVTVPGVDHAFMNDTGPRFDPAAAASTYQLVLSWFGTHLATT
ncbi:dienelactone hydrolase family protein [Pseudonocardia sp.]|uniref:dienelactone hydrolase family protein n=1 Tax=Pseudonocardia sp. TaxID=60912 RepID=UPI003D11BC2F